MDERFQWNAQKAAANLAKHDGIVRIIGARKATKHEREFYAEGS